MVWETVLVTTGAIASGILVFYFEKRRKIKSLRTALQAELISMKALTDAIRESPKEIENEEWIDVIGSHSTTIYETAGAELGLLTTAPGSHDLNNVS